MCAPQAPPPRWKAPHEWFKGRFNSAVASLPPAGGVETLTHDAAIPAVVGGALARGAAPPTTGPAAAATASTEICPYCTGKRSHLLACAHPPPRTEMRCPAHCKIDCRHLLICHYIICHHQVRRIPLGRTGGELASAAKASRTSRASPSALPSGVGPALLRHTSRVATFYHSPHPTTSPGSRCA